jgi:branched-chain amino acid transport system substrate-binding protein
MNKKVWIGIAIVIIIAAGAIAMKQKKTPTAQETIKVGMSVCLTGSCAEWGENAVKGAQLAVEKNNTNTSNKKIELVIDDSQEDQIPRAIASYQKLKNQGVQFFFTPTWTPAALALGPIVSKDDVVVITASVGIKDYHESGENIFNAWPIDEAGTRYLARFVKSQGINTVAIISSKQPWEETQGNAFADEFTKQGGKITLKTEPSLTEKDFKTTALTIINQKTEAVFYSNLNNMGTAAKDLKNLGFQGRQYSVLMDQTRLDQASGALNGTIYVQAPEADQKFITEFKAKYNTAPGVSSDTAYDAVMWLASALNTSSDTSPEKIASVMRNMQSLENTANGTLTFNKNGSVLRDPALWVVDNGLMKKYVK